MDVVRAQRWTDLGLLVLRVVLGIVMFMHGYQKVFEMGVGGVEQFFGSLGLPVPGISALLVSYLELVGGALLVLGVATRLLGLAFAFELLVALFTAHLSKGFYSQDGGYELVLMLAAAALALALTGPGAWSVDAAVGRRRRVAAEPVP
ncbi:MAG TPA: DoxX family protein [Longimicrobium sp.]|nr:DoxX family protein [Longimicrobium sp.]